MENRRAFLKRSSMAAVAAATAAALPTLSSCVTISTIRAKVPMKSKEIKKAAVLWYSQTGNTRKCGEVLAKTLENKGITVDHGDLRNFDKPKIGDVDLLVIGSPVFYYDTPEYVKNFIRSLPDLKGTPVASYVTFGGPEGNQHNAACSILEGLAQKNGVPVGLETFMSISSYPLSFKKKEANLKTGQNTILPDRKTYERVREYAAFVKAQVEKKNTSEFKKTLTLREFSTFFGPEWWTKQSVDNHSIIQQACVECGTCVMKCPTDSIDLDAYTINRTSCVLCFGCLNNCEYQAVNMEYKGERLISFQEYLKKNNLKFELPVETNTSG
ncbi:MAG: twin-arginine translocation signal domain-containing protein [Deltaproteobacteria bacterium]|nr:twin-arginine translocation signal domain-containing protein [Deltaproteobacteria bacterium]